MERDRLDAHFCRFGSGFMTKNNVNEALESTAKINQILIQYQKSLESDSGNPRPLGSPLLPMKEAQKSVPIYAHSNHDGNLL
jgi:hypothetical protein